MATAASIDLNAQYESCDLPLDLIDEPRNAERETMDEAALAELAMSIAEVGLIQALTVKRVGDRYEVVAGHRRLLACRLVNYSPAPCRVRTEGDVDALAVLVAENAHREEVNPIEEAQFYFRLYSEKCGHDVDAVCAMVRRKRAYVEDRLVLLDGYPQVVNALRQGRISIAVARVLNKAKDPNRMLICLDTACSQGATARQVAEWIRDGEAMGDVQLPAMDPAAQEAAALAFSQAYKMECLFCQSDKHVHTMKQYYLHDPCKDIIDSMLQRAPANPAA